MITLLILFATILALLVWLQKPRFNTFRTRNIPHQPFNWENFQLFQKVHFQAVIQKVYDATKSKGPIAGYYLGITPMFMVTDIELVRKISIKDFNSFFNRGLFHNERADPLSLSLLTMEDEQWKSTRSKLTPSFSSGKIKAMFPTILNISNTLNNVLYESANEAIDYDLLNVFMRFTSDVIGQCGFGLDCNGLRNPNAEFVRFGDLATRSAADMSSLKGLFKMEMRGFCRYLGLSRYSRKAQEFFSSIVKQTIKYREENDVTKADIMNSLIELKNRGEMTEGDVIAQCYIFFAAGFHTTANSLYYLFYNLAKYPELQKKVRENIFEVLKDHGNEFTYESFQDMQILDKFMLESLRRHPTSTVIIRQASMDYKVPDTEYWIKKGEWITVPILSMHLDSRYYPNPKDINIDRDFSNVLNFGIGPRACIAERFAKMELKIALVNFLRSYRVTRTKDTPMDLTLDKGSRLLTSKQRMYLKIEKL